MRKFIRNNYLQQMEWPDDLKYFKGLLNSSEVGSVGEAIKDFGQKDILCLPHMKRIALDQDDISLLNTTYGSMYPDFKIINTLRISESCQRIKLKGTVITSLPTVGILVRTLHGTVRPAKVDRFIQNEVVLSKDGKRKTLSHALAEVKFFKEHPQKTWYPDPIEVWCNDEVYAPYISVENIVGQIFLVKYKVKFRHGLENVIICIPLVRKF